MSLPARNRHSVYSSSYDNASWHPIELSSL